MSPDVAARVAPAGAYPAVSERLASRGAIHHLDVVDTVEVTPRMRRVRLSGAGVADLRHRPGQSLILVLPQADGSTAARHYTIRAIDAAARLMSIDFVLHGDTPANRWIRAARAGDRISAVGPRGRVVLNPRAPHHLFCADETGLPAVLSMLEALPEEARAEAFIEVATADEIQPVATAAKADIAWLVREPGARPGAAVTARVAAYAPSGRLHAYLVGETGEVRAQRHSLLANGLDKPNISAEGYWRPGRVGGHDHVED